MSLFSWFKFWILVLYILPVTTGQSQLISSPQPITVRVGDDVILPCRLDPPISASSRSIEWTKPGLDPEYIHVHQDGHLVYQSQNPLYFYRTALFVDQLINGNVSMKLYRVKNSDAGKYRCFIPSLWKEAFIHLSVGEEAKDKDDFFTVPSSCSDCSTSIAPSVLFGFMFTAAVVLFVWICRKYKNDLRKTHPPQIAPLTEPQNKDKEYDDVVILLKKTKTELEEQKDQLRVDLDKVVTEREKNKKQLRSVEAEITAREHSFDKPEELLRKKENLLKEQWKLDERKKYLEKEIMNREKLLEPIENKFAKENKTSVYVNIP